MELEEQNNYENDSEYELNRYVPKAVKFCAALTMTIGFLLYRIVYNMDFTHICFYDLLQSVTYSINRNMYHDKNSIVLLIGQICIDVSIPAYTIYWLLYLKNMRLLMAIVFFNVFRTVSINVWKMPFPPDMVWRQPPFPSLLVSYARTRDFYFSGHTGHILLLTAQIVRINLPLWVKILMLLQLLYMIFMLIVSRVHYTIDIVGGFIFGLFCFYLSEKFIFYFDFLWSLPHLGYKKIKEKCCLEEEEDNLLVEQLEK